MWAVWAHSPPPGLSLVDELESCTDWDWCWMQLCLESCWTGERIVSDAKGTKQNKSNLGLGRWTWLGNLNSLPASWRKWPSLTRLQVFGWRKVRLEEFFATRCQRPPQCLCSQWQKPASCSSCPCLAVSYRRPMLCSAPLSSLQEEGWTDGNRVLTSLWAVSHKITNSYAHLDKCKYF